MVTLAKLEADLGIEARPLIVHEDNQAAIALSRDIKFSEKTKHMQVRWSTSRRWPATEWSRSPTSLRRSSSPTS